MTVPSRQDKMIKNLMKQKDRNMLNKCFKQFPECPLEPNKMDCGKCPFWSDIYENN